MTRLLCLVLMLFGLGSCGESTSVSAPPTVFDLTCGDIVVSGNPSRATSSDSALQSANCFAQSYRTCRPTTLTIDDRTNKLTRQFSIVAASSGCTLRQALQTDPSSPPAVADCGSVAVANRTLQIKDCSHLGDFTLPL